MEYFYRSYGIGCISYLMPNNLKLDPMAIPNAAAFYHPFHYHEECGQVVDFAGNRIL